MGYSNESHDRRVESNETRRSSAIQLRHASKRIQLGPISGNVHFGRQEIYIERAIVESTQCQETIQEVANVFDGPERDDGGRRCSGANTTIGHIPSLMVLFIDFFGDNVALDAYEFEYKIVVVIRIRHNFSRKKFGTPLVSFPIRFR